MTDFDSALRVSHLTLSPSNVVTHSIIGYFSQTKHPEILCVRGNGEWLQLLTLISSSLHSICLSNIFGQIRTMNKVSSSNLLHQTDLIAITTNAGKLIILQYDKNSKSQNVIQCFRIITQYQVSKNNGFRKDQVGHYSKCIQLKQKNEYLFFISAPFETHLFLKLILSFDGIQSEWKWSKFAKHTEANTVIFDTSYTYLMSNDNKKSLYCVSLQCLECLECDNINIQQPPPTKKRKLMNNMDMIKTVKFYKIDLSNNDIGDVYSVRVSNTSHLILSIPLNINYGLFGGIIVCSANIISYISPQSNGECQQLHCFIPQRILEEYDDDDENKENKENFNIKPSDIIINTFDTYYNDKDLLYILIQTDRGDICKITMLCNNKSSHFQAFSIEVLDAMPLSHSISIFPSSQYIFFGAQSTNNYLCKIKCLGNNNNKSIISTSFDDKALLFEPRLNKHFKFIQEYNNLNNLIKIKVDDLLNEIQPQIYCLCGRGQQSSLKILRYGLCVTPLGKQNLSQFEISRVWTVSTSSFNSLTTNLIIISSQHLTMLFKLNKLNNDEIIDIPVQQTPFDNNSNTLHFGTMYIGDINNNNNDNNDNILDLCNNLALIQITCFGIYFVTSTNINNCYCWKPGGNQRITHGVSTSSIICVTLNDQFIILLKPINSGQNLNKLCMIGKKLEIHPQIIDIDIMDNILVIVTSNQYLTIYNINDIGIELLNRFSICDQEKLDSDKISSVCLQKFSSHSYGHLFVGTNNGYLFRFSLSSIYHILKPFNPNFVSTLNSEFIKNLGSHSVRLVACNLGFNQSTKNINNYQRCIIAISSKNYIITQYDDKFNYNNCFESRNNDNNNNNNNNNIDWQYDILQEMRCIPLLYSYNDVINNQYQEKRIIFDDCSSFILPTNDNDNDNDKTIMSRFIVIDSESNSIQIYGIENIDNIFESTQFNLRYTPRDMVIYNLSKYIKAAIIIESDNREYSNIKRKELLKGDNNKNKNKNKNNQEIQRIIGYPRPLQKNQWVSCFRVINPQNPSNAVVQELPQNEAAFSIQICRLLIGSSISNQFNDFLVIGTALNMTSNKINSCKNGQIRIYKMLNTNNQQIEPNLIRKKIINGLPKYICSYRGGLMVAFGKKIEFYRFNNNHNNNHNDEYQYDLINDKRFNIEISDRIKSGNFYITKIEIDDNNNDEKEEEEEDEDYLPNLFICDNLNGFYLFKYNINNKKFDYIFCHSNIHKPLSLILLDSKTLAISSLFGIFYISRINGNKCQNLIEFYVGDIITSIDKSKLSPLGKQLIIYSTITGSIGCFIPFLSGINADFFDTLQYYLSSKIQTLSGESHTLFRSKYMPSKNCSDYDFCFNFKNISHSEKQIFQKGINIPMPKISQNISSLQNIVV